MTLPVQKINDLAECASHGLGIYAAAKHVGVSYKTARKYAECSGIEFLATTSERDLEIMRRVEVGEALVSIGKDYGISRQRVHQIAQASGLSRGERWSVKNVAPLF